MIWGEMRNERLTELWLRCREAMLSASGDDETGQGMVEYAFILVLIALVVIIILTVVGKQVNNLYSNVSSGLAT
jgi:pilus assembly protein Flp/PilA